MKITKVLTDVLIIEPDIYRDNRGYFFESCKPDFPFKFVQDNVSFSKQNVLRGLHYQLENTQGKLVTCLQGTVQDVMVDLRKSSPTFGQYHIVTLHEGGCQVYIPEGFAHGFRTTREENLVHYKCTAPYDPKSQITLIWNDPTINIDWNCKYPILSQKDAEGLTFQWLKDNNKLF